MSSDVTFHPAPAGQFRFTCDDRTYTWNPEADPGQRFLRADGTAVLEAAEVAGFLLHVAAVEGAPQALAQRVLLRHLVHIDDYDSMDDLSLTFVSWLCAPELLFSVLATSDATDWGVRLVAEMSDPVNAMLRAAISHGQLHVLNAGHLVEFCLEGIRQDAFSIGQACDVLVLSLLLIDPALADPEAAAAQCFAIAETVIAAGVNITAREHLLDAAFTALTANPTRATWVQMGDLASLPAPEGLPAALLFGLVLEAGGLDRAAVAEGLRVFSVAGRSGPWLGMAASPQLLRHMLILGASYGALLLLVDDDGERADVPRVMRHLCSVPQGEWTDEQFSKLTAVTYLAVLRHLPDAAVSSVLTMAEAVTDHATQETLQGLVEFYADQQ